MPIPGITSKAPRLRYDVVVVGGGAHGLALAYELTQQGIRDVAVLEAAYPGSGASGRNGELIRSAFSSPEWCRLFEVSLSKWKHLSAELDYNVLFTSAGYMIVASTAEQVAQLKRDHRSHSNFGVQTRYLDATETLAVVPSLAPAEVAGGLIQDGAGYAHHDATVWGYAQAAARGGAEIFPYLPVRAITVLNGSVVGVKTDQGEISTGLVVNAAGAFARDVSAMAGVEVPTERYRLEIIATESLKPFLRPSLALLEPLGYCHQTSRGEFVGGTEYAVANPADNLNTTLTGIRDIATKFVRWIPRLAGARVVRHWAGLVDKTFDLAPVMGPVPGVDGLYLDCGWIYGFMAVPGAALLLARSIASGAVDPVVAPFTVERLWNGTPIPEQTVVIPMPKDADSVS